jgi:hypothetical protein
MVEMAAKKYRRMSRAEKLRFAAGGHEYVMIRCNHCNVQIDHRDAAAHLGRCWPEVVMALFTKLR